MIQQNAEVLPLEKKNKIEFSIMSESDNAEVLNLLGLIAQAKGLHQQAEELFYFALKQAPQRAPFYYNLAFSFKMDNKPREAIENFEKALHIQPNIKEAYNELGSLYQQTGNLEKAKECWQKALTIDADYAEAKANLINFSGKTDVELIQELENLHASYPQNALVLFYLVKKLIENSLWSKAESNVSFLQKLLLFLMMQKFCGDKFYMPNKNTKKLNCILKKPCRLIQTI